ncbi:MULTISPECIES: hypothetical protein [unclassified Flavobacterium]|uniref:hypothetical protein n=1 Tax=unclassified Flavobacterium TaxID=196869 RepID=UPI001291A23D|nr:MULTISPECIES: hypothetical protein [unclassified Flavobacterium]MQP52964.1 hypothetical protein [Flavobacterium sp. LMO9]MQP63147.1 hypothetical protein [Flavobacterium sp. LMO6]
MRNLNSKIELEVYLTNNLNYSVISRMDFNEFKEFVLKLFKEINELKNEGLKRDDIFDFIQNLYKNEMSMADEKDVLFERRFSGITEELTSFCADPMFWYTDDFEIFIKKWQKSFEYDWYKIV